MTRWSGWAKVLGLLSVFTILLSPALLPALGADVVTASVLPLGFFVTGSAAVILRPAHRVGYRMLAVGALHLVAFALAVVVVLWPGPWTTVVAGYPSAVLFGLGFVALLDLLARFPTGDHAWPVVERVVSATAVVVVGLVTVAFLGSARAPSIFGLQDVGPNPAHLPALAPLAGAIVLVALPAVVGVGLLLARYPKAPPLDQAQMRWPILTAVVLLLGLLTTGLVEHLLGPGVQTALFVTAATALPASFLVGLLRHTEQRERLAAVEASRTRLAAVADAERRRIERDLHDGVQQQLLALLAQTELARARIGASDAAIDEELQRISEGIRGVHRDLRELARGIHPAVLTDHGLGEAVRSALARLPVRTDLEVAPEVEGARYLPTVEGAAYFLVLEGVANAMKHAGTTEPRVRLTSHDDVLEVRVDDSGPGFTASRADGTGSGLVGLRDRVSAVGGRLEIDSRPGAGTTVRGLFPVRHATS